MELFSELYRFYKNLVGTNNAMPVKVARTNNFDMKTSTKEPWTFNSNTTTMKTQSNRTRNIIT